MHKVQVLFFATLKEKAGVSEAELELPAGSRVADLKRLLLSQYPGLPEARSAMLVAVNQEYAFDEDPVPDGAQVAVFPPVSGGSGAPEVFAVTEGEIDLNDLLAQITTPSSGATCLFSGMVRAETLRGEPRKTLRLEYEAYKPMAEAKMRQVAEEIRERWPQVEGIAIVQRIGILQPGTPTVLIACSGGHRDSGVFEAARYGIDRLKEIVPVWKKEIGPQGEEWVEGEYIPEAGD
ncbi:MAG: molybdopterin converting factor subunit 1 [Anaerolineales bacterium]|nr:molybdopterin converting factor subunit 1 [Anaerolineales bacterium]